MVEDYIKKQIEIRNYFDNKYRRCKSTLERLIVDIDYRGVQDRIWEEFTEIFNKK